MLSLLEAVLLFCVLAVLALATADDRQKTIFTVIKPLVTLSLALVVGAPPVGSFATIVMVGLVLAAIGDAILTISSDLAFLAGLGAFTLVHLAYTVAFLFGGAAGPLFSSGALGMVVASGATFWFIRRIWIGVSPGLRVPVQIYALVITGMVGAGYFVLAGAGPGDTGLYAAGGAVLFYLSDAILGWNKFRRPLRNYQLWNLSFYWAGQLLVALAAREMAGG